MKWLNPNLSFINLSLRDSKRKPTPEKDKEFTNPKLTPIIDFWNKREKDEWDDIFKLGLFKKEISRQEVPRLPLTKSLFFLKNKVKFWVGLILTLNIFFIF